MDEKNIIIKEIAHTYIEAELSKIESLLSQNIPDYMKKFCSEMSHYLTKLEENVWDKPDLLDLRSKLQFISEFINLLLGYSQGKPSWWALPLIHQCYELCQIDLNDRHVLIIHSPVSDSYQVYTDIIIDYLTFDFSEDYKFDIFVIPQEASYDLASIALIGHEVGHVYWQKHHEKIKKHIDAYFKGDKKFQEANLFTSNELKESKKRIAAHIEEYLCDRVGSHLLGPAFDFALLKLFCSSPSSLNDSGSETHPPEQNRIDMAFDRLCSITSSTEELNEGLKNIIAKIKSLNDKKLLDFKKDETAQKLTNKIFESHSIQGFLAKWRIEEIWEKVKPELDAFRPPVEKVNDGIPEIISPIESIIGTVIYYYGGYYLTSNEYFQKSISEENSKKSTLRKSLINHVKYSINLYNFVKAANILYRNIDFRSEKLKSTLWIWRKRIYGGDSNPLVVIPTIDPERQYGTNGIDLRLGSSFLVHKPTRYTHIIPTPDNDESKNQLSEFYETVDIPINKQFILHPHQFVLASTLEYICLPFDYYGLVLGRSTWGRLGLNIATATEVQAGFRGCLTLELRNLGETPLPLTIGTRIAQICLIKIPEGINTPKGYFSGESKYVGPISSEIPKIKNDHDWILFEEIKKLLNKV